MAFVRLHVRRRAEGDDNDEQRREDLQVRIRNKSGDRGDRELACHHERLPNHYYPAICRVAGEEKPKSLPHIVVIVIIHQSPLAADAALASLLEQTFRSFFFSFASFAFFTSFFFPVSASITFPAKQQHEADADGNAESVDD